MNKKASKLFVESYYEPDDNLIGFTFNWVRRILIFNIILDINVKFFIL